MFVIRGHKKQVEPIGRVADYCPICRDVGIFKLLSIRLVRHYYNVGFGRGPLIGHAASCESCKYTRSVDATSYTQVAKASSGDTVQGLIQQTQPDVWTRYADQLALDRTLEIGSAGGSYEVRAERLRLIIQGASYRLETRYDDGIDGRWLLVALALLIVPSAALVLLQERGQAPDGSPLHVALVLTCMSGLAVTLWHGLTWKSRWRRDNLLPWLAAGLRDLVPTLTELEAVLDRFRSAQTTVGKVVKPSVLMQAVLDKPTQKT